MTQNTYIMVRSIPRLKRRSNAKLLKQSDQDRTHKLTEKLLNRVALAQVIKAMPPRSFNLS